MADILSQAKTRQCKIAIDALIYDPAHRQLSKAGKEIELEPRSQELLEVLLQQTGTPISADELIAKVWQSSFISKNVLTNRISTLRAIFKEHSPESDATKLLVTYPKKGYYLNAARVSLVETVKQPLANPPTPSPKKWSIHLVYIAILLVTVGLFIGLSPQQESKNTTAPASSSITVPVVELLLHKVNITDNALKPYVKAIKTSLLAQQIAYPYINVINQDAPSYFLSQIDDGLYWPGSRNTLFSDYKLNLRLSKGRSDVEIIAQLELVFHSSEKRIFHGEYSLDIKELDSGISRMTADLAKFFALPAVPQPQQSDTLAFVSKTMAAQLDSQQLSSSEVNYLARQLLQTPVLEPLKMTHWLERMERDFPNPEEEMEIWLGLLNFKMGQHENARERLFKARFNNQIDNAFVYLVLSDLALKENKPDLFRLYYLKSQVSLSLVLPSKQIFTQLEPDNLQHRCLGAWESLIKNERLSDDLGTWIDIFQDYCDRAQTSFPAPQPKKAAYQQPIPGDNT